MGMVVFGIYLSGYPNISTRFELTSTTRFGTALNTFEKTIFFKNTSKRAIKKLIVELKRTLLKEQNKTFYRENSSGTTQTEGVWKKKSFSSNNPITDSASDNVRIASTRFDLPPGLIRLSPISRLQLKYQKII
uniref:Uncharacterized protein n=1 Tax=Cacopsylla melanoneura TaxID=428564 RepID=A0A8D9E4X0_9HEMI